MSDVQNVKSTDSIRTFVLLALGEIGQRIDLSGYQQLKSVSKSYLFIQMLIT